jgi:hypothetical protein
MLVYGYQQLLGAERLLRSLVVKEDRCEANFWVKGNVVAAEALHLSLQELGVPVAHHFVNSVVVPRALQDDVTLAATVRMLASDLTTPISPAICERLQSMPAWPYLESPDLYIGDAKKLALREAENCL